MVVENIGGFEVKTTKKEGKLGAKFKFLEFNQINGKVQHYKRDYKINLDIENIAGLGIKTAKKGKLGAEFAWKLMCPEYYQIIEEICKATTEIMKIYMFVENVVGLGVKTAKKESKLGVTFAWKIKVSRIQTYQWKGTT